MKESLRSIDEMYGIIDEMYRIIVKSWEMIQEEIVNNGLFDAGYDLIDDATNLVYMCTSVQTYMSIFFKDKIECADLESLYNAYFQIPPCPSTSSLAASAACPWRLIVMKNRLDSIINTIMTSKHRRQCPHQFKVEVTSL